MNRKLTKFLSIYFIINFTLFISCCIAQKSYYTFGLLHQNIVDVTIKDVVYKQTFQEKNGSFIVSFKILNSDKQEEEEYECNLSDLNEYKVELNASRQRTFSVDENFKALCNFDLKAQNIEDARLIREAIKHYRLPVQTIKINLNI